MKTRKEMKARAKKVLRKHYWLFVVLCLTAGFIGSEFRATYSVSDTESEETEDTSVNVTSLMTTKMSDQLINTLIATAGDEDEAYRELSRQSIEETIQNTSETAILGRSRGVISRIVNSVSSGEYLATLAITLRSATGSKNAAIAIMIIVSALLYLFVQVFVISVYKVILRRMILEGDRYEKVPIQRVWFLARVKRWFHTGWVLLRVSIQHILWSLTIIGGIIKYFSYIMVPFILAENPNMSSKEAIGLSCRMMKGHKWEYFKLEFSFILWDLLGALTFSILDLLFTNPYKLVTTSQYYQELRKLAIEKNIPGAELLNDTYLYQEADEETLRTAYADIIAESEKPEAELPKLNVFARFFMSWFGVTFRNSKKIEAYENDQVRKISITRGLDCANGKAYPSKLFPISEKKERQWIQSMNYMRYYSIWSLLLIFFATAFIGWVWEVSLHLMTDGEFVNRGVLHGPWLPIYGMGSMVILVVLKKFRKIPGLEFIMAMIASGAVEYYTSWYLEMTHDGQRWWDYTGYFLNLNGRICAEGLLVFGLAGLLMVYVIAPFLDTLIRKIPYKAVVAAALILLSVYTVDQVYSSKHPNTGKGITDYQS